MTHNFERSNAWREAQLGLFTGSIYGATHTLTGHPLDTVKSKMQIQKGFADLSSINVIKIIWQKEGFVGFYRGCVPPLWGSMVSITTSPPSHHVIINFASLVVLGISWYHDVEL